MNQRLLMGLTGFAATAAGLAYHAGLGTWGRENLALLSPGLVPHYQAATPLPGPVYTWEIVAYALIAAACLGAGLKLAGVLASGAGLVVDLARGRRALGESGQAMTEVAVSFPILLVTTLGLMQLALLYQAKNYVTYAAFAATRAAIVWIPAEADGEGKHQINTDGGEKLDKIQQAAAMAVVPVSPRAGVVLDGIPFLGDLLSSVSGLAASLGSVGEAADNGIQRYAYAAFATDVVLYKGGNDGLAEQSGTVTWNWPEESDVGVRVWHRYYLPIPVANRFFGSNWSLIDLGPIFSLDLPGRYSMLQSIAVLPLEGETGNPPITGFWDWL
jgi:hypothetical protein